MPPCTVICMRSRSSAITSRIASSETSVSSVTIAGDHECAAPTARTFADSRTIAASSSTVRGATRRRGVKRTLRP